MNKTTSGSKTGACLASKDCQVVDIGIDGFAECLMSGPNTCKYALPFGYCFLCGHPRVSEALGDSAEKKKPAVDAL